MADDPNPQLRAELMAALTILNREISGLNALSAGGVAISAELRSIVVNELIRRERRRDLIRDALDALDKVVSRLYALEADGYPYLDPVAVAGSLFVELNDEMTDIENAVAVFRADPAAHVTIRLGEPVEKNQS